MKKGKKTRRTRIGITAAVTALILLIAFFCYQTVKKAGKGEKGSLMYFACAWRCGRNRRFAGMRKALVW